MLFRSRTPSGELIRWVEGTAVKNAEYAHIYLMVGCPPFKATQWFFAEPTLKTVNLGWDVVAATKDRQNKSMLPELSGVQEIGANVAKALDWSEEELDIRPATIWEDVRKAITPRRVVAGLCIGAVYGMIAAGGKSLVGVKK